MCYLTVLKGMKILLTKKWKANMAKIVVNAIEIRTVKINSEDYICLTDMLKAKDGEFFFHNWLRNRNTIEFLGIWEKVYNPAFNYAEFDIIKSQAGLNSYRLSAKEWMEKTGAIGIISKTGRYGGTYAHKDIAFEFAMWISPEFKVYLIKEFQRLKSEEQKQLGWSAKRELTKLNYRIHTDAIKQNLIPSKLDRKKSLHRLCQRSRCAEYGNVWNDRAGMAECQSG